MHRRASRISGSVLPEQPLIPHDGVLAARKQSSYRPNFYVPTGLFALPSDPICWYHQKWGSRARSCRQPYSFRASVLSTGPHHHLNLRDTVSNHRFLVDTGTAASVSPYHPSKPYTAVGLVEADGSEIRSWGHHFKFWPRPFHLGFPIGWRRPLHPRSRLSRSQ